MPTPANTQLKDRAFYRHWHDIAIRVSDLDDQRHVNNAIFAVYCEEGRRNFLEAARDLIREEQVMIFIAHLSIDFHREISYPGAVAVGTTIKHIGNSSYVMAQALFTSGGCHATIEVVSVVASAQTRGPIPIPAALRGYLESRMGVKPGDGPGVVVNGGNATDPA